MALYDDNSLIINAKSLKLLQSTKQVLLTNVSLWWYLLKKLRLCLLLRSLAFWSMLPISPNKLYKRYGLEAIIQDANLADSKN